MYLTQESRNARWVGLIGLWIVLGLLIGLHAEAFRDYIRFLDTIGLEGAKAATTPLKRSCPTMYADAQMWVRHALALAGGAGPQLRYTMVDNAPFGREVHWDSGFAWLIVGAGELRHLLFGEPFPTGVEESMAWINVPLLLAFIIGFSTWAARRAGLGAGILVGFLMLANPDFFSGFAPNYIDHHGLLAAAVLGLFLGAIFMGIGFWREPDSAASLLPVSYPAARTGAVVSAALGAFGMWISAATLIPAIAIMGIAGAISILLFGNKARGRGVTLEPDLWRTWGRVGGIASLAFYLIEYAPAHLGFRMEVNHPAYALGWWGGSEIIAQLAECRRDGKWPIPRKRALIAAFAAVSVAPAIIAIGGERVFVVFDPFVTRLSAHVAEGLSFFTQAKIFGMGRVWEELPWTGVTLLLGAILCWRARPADRLLAVFCVLAYLASLAMALRQVRWWPSVSGPEFCLLLLGLASFSGLRRLRVGWLCTAAGAAILVVPAVGRITAQRDLNRRHVVDAIDVFQPFYRNVAAVLRASQPKGEIVLLSSPNSSVAIGYYGRFKTIGTLYWENLDGTKAAAEMFAAPTEIAARRLIRDRGVTHVAMISYESFLTEYYSLLYPAATQPEFQNSFGYKLLVNGDVPLWLDPIPYTYPPDIPRKIDRIGLYRTRFSDPKAEADYDAAVADFDANRVSEGEEELDAALAIAPHSGEFWLVKSHVRLARHDPPGALDALRHALANCSPDRHAAMLQNEGNRFYQVHAQAEAAQLYREAIALRFDATAANNLVWILATSRDAAVRNGPEALRIAEKLVPDHPQDATILTGYAAALAECERYTDAANVQARILEAANSGGNPALVESAKARLASYRAGKPWRE